MPIDWRRLRKTIVDPASGTLLSLLAAYALALSANLAAGLLQPHTSIALAIVLGAPAIIFLVLAVPHLVRALADTAATPSATFQPARRHRWLIALASPLDGIKSAEAAIRYHLPHLERVYLICSRGEPPDSSSTAVQLRDRLAAEGVLDLDQIRLILLSRQEFKDLEIVRRRIEDIYSERPGDVAPGDLVIDITGGLKTTAAGALLAGLPHGRHLEYVTGEEFTAAGYVLKPGEPYEIFVDLQSRGRP